MPLSGRTPPPTATGGPAAAGVIMFAVMRDVLLVIVVLLLSWIALGPIFALLIGVILLVYFCSRPIGAAMEWLVRRVCDIVRRK